MPDATGALQPVSAAAATSVVQPTGRPCLTIVGFEGGTHIGGSLLRAAARIGCDASLLDSSLAFEGPGLLRSLAWRFAGHRPLRLRRFSRRAIASCRPEPPARSVFVATGAAPLTRHALRLLRSSGVRCVNFSTDDPGNTTQSASWHLRALPEYDVVCTPRRANLDDFRRLGCGDVRYLPFGYDEDLFESPRRSRTALDTQRQVLFVGGADSDRTEFMTSFIHASAGAVSSGLALVGGYWSRSPVFKAFALGHKTPTELTELTAAAAVNLCLVRRANRDGHVMRSFEIPAVGGFMLAEDTREHREIFGAEGRCVLYFDSPQAAAKKAAWALEHPRERLAMARAGYELITTGGHTYSHRLETMLAAAGEGSPT